MSLTCPRCVGTLTEVKISTHYGGFIVVSQCQQCGGIWFDPFEYSQIASTEIEKLDNVNAHINPQPLTTNAPQKCPNDQSVLVKFQDITIPKNLTIERCSVCGGYWFDKGELMQWKGGVEAKKQSNATAKIDLNAFLPSQTNSGVYDTVRKVSGILMTPMNGDRVMSDDPSAQAVADYAFLAFDIIMRLMLRSF